MGGSKSVSNYCGTLEIKRKPRNTVGTVWLKAPLAGITIKLVVSSDCVARPVLIFGRFPQASDTQLVHPRTKSTRVHPENDGRATCTFNAPMGSFEHGKYVSALHLQERQFTGFGFCTHKNVTRTSGWLIGGDMVVKINRFPVLGEL